MSSATRGRSEWPSSQHERSNEGCAPVSGKARRAEQGLPEAERIQFRIGNTLATSSSETGGRREQREHRGAPRKNCGAGGICISGAVYEQVNRTMRSTMSTVADAQLKNIAGPVRVFRVRNRKSVEGDTRAVAPTSRRPAIGPSIAILPFDNLSEPGESYLCDGSSRTSSRGCPSSRSLLSAGISFAYRGVRLKPTDRRELGSAISLLGSVRGRGRIRITSQLLDGARGQVLWAEPLRMMTSRSIHIQDAVIQRLSARLAICPRKELSGTLAPHREKRSCRLRASPAGQELVGASTGTPT